MFNGEMQNAFGEAFSRWNRNQNDFNQTFNKLREDSLKYTPEQYDYMWNVLEKNGIHVPRQNRNMIRENWDRLGFKLPNGIENQTYMGTDGNGMGGAV